MFLEDQKVLNYKDYAKSKTRCTTKARAKRPRGLTATRKVTRRANAKGVSKMSPKVSFRTREEGTKTQIEAGTTSGIQDGLIDLRTRPHIGARM